MKKFENKRIKLLFRENVIAVGIIKTIKKHVGAPLEDSELYEKAINEDGTFDGYDVRFILEQNTKGLNFDMMIVDETLFIKANDEIITEMAKGYEQHIIFFEIK